MILNQSMMDVSVLHLLRVFEGISMHLIPRIILMCYANHTFCSSPFSVGSSILWCSLDQKEKKHDPRHDVTSFWDLRCSCVQNVHHFSFVGQAKSLHSRGEYKNTKKQQNTGTQEGIDSPTVNWYLRWSAQMVTEIFGDIGGDWREELRWFTGTGTVISGRETVVIYGDTFNP